MPKEETEEATPAIEALEQMVGEILLEADERGMSYFDTACLVFFRGMDLGHEMGHFCAQMNANGEGVDDAGDARALAGYL